MPDTTEGSDPSDIESLGSDHPTPDEPADVHPSATQPTTEEPLPGLDEDPPEESSAVLQALGGDTRPSCVNRDTILAQLTQESATVHNVDSIGL
jgi:hypothetical protein